MSLLTLIEERANKEVERRLRDRERAFHEAVSPFLSFSETYPEMEPLLARLRPAWRKWIDDDVQREVAARLVPFPP